jgi:cell pole-organizing protein PopZ
MASDNPKLLSLLETIKKKIMKIDSSSKKNEESSMQVEIENNKSNNLITENDSDIVNKTQEQPSQEYLEEIKNIIAQEKQQTTSKQNQDLQFEIKQQNDSSQQIADSQINPTKNQQTQEDEEDYQEENPHEDNDLHDEDPHEDDDLQFEIKQQNDSSQQIADSQINQTKNQQTQEDEDDSHEDDSHEDDSHEEDYHDEDPHEDNDLQDEDPHEDDNLQFEIKQETDSSQQIDKINTSSIFFKQEKNYNIDFSFDRKSRNYEDDDLVFKIMPAKHEEKLPQNSEIDTKDFSINNQNSINYDLNEDDVVDDADQNIFIELDKQNQTEATNFDTNLNNNELDSAAIQAEQQIEKYENIADFSENNLSDKINNTTNQDSATIQAEQDLSAEQQIALSENDSFNNLIDTADNSAIQNQYNQNSQENNAYIEQSIQQNTTSLNSFSNQKEQENPNQPDDSEQSSIIHENMSSKNHDLIKEQTAFSISKSIDKLTEAQQTLSNVNKITQDENLKRLLQEMIEPKLEQWLNNNLPDLVEKIVQTEIEKLFDKNK